MNLQENIRRILWEVRVPRSERVELYKDNNIIVVVPLTHRALKKYANQCQWCINSDIDEWEDYHQGKHAVIIQRNPKKPKIGITGHPTASEIFFLAKWVNNESSFEDVCQMLDYEFRNDRTMSDYYANISNDINNFGTNIVYYSPENGTYDQEDNFLSNFNYEISDIPNITPEVIKIIDNYLQEEKEMSLQENIRRILRKELLNESDPKTGTGKKPKGSGRRLYTDENPNDTVSVKFRTKEDIVDTLNKDSFKSKPHKRQSQIINLIHQRVRVVYQNAKDLETKKRLKRAYDYIVSEKEKSKEKTIRLQKQEQNESELTEKCWPGYTQKGMKTMFGKRYPNCVKKSKK